MSEFPRYARAPANARVAVFGIPVSKYTTIFNDLAPAYYEWDYDGPEMEVIIRIRMVGMLPYEERYIIPPLPRHFKVYTDYVATELKQPVPEYECKEPFMKWDCGRCGVPEEECNYAREHFK